MRRDRPARFGPALDGLRVDPSVVPDWQSSG